MESINRMFEKRNSGELILSVLFIIYLVMGFKLPEPLANVIDTLVGKIVVAIFALALFSYTNPILGVLGVFVAYKIIMSASMVTGTGALEMFAPTEARKWSQFSPMHQFPYTLEQEVVKKMAPIVRTDLANTKPSYKPMLENLYDAASINYKGPI
jgi:hypothetical protein